LSRRLLGEGDHLDVAGVQEPQLEAKNTFQIQGFSNTLKVVVDHQGESELEQSPTFLKRDRGEPHHALRRTGLQTAE